ncbi:MAG: CBM35 domain-containing protein [Opitutaceae bacterium]
MMLRDCLLFALSLSVSASAFAAAQEFYVSPYGNDINPGSREQPFKTIERARDAIRRVNHSMSDDIIVYLGGGMFPIEETIEFTPADSGTNGHQIIYKAFGNSETILNGATKVTGWRPYKGEIYQAPLNHSDKLRSLFVSGERAYMASKNAGVKGGWGEFKVQAGQADWAWVSGSTVDGIRFNQKDVPDLNNPEDVEILRNTKFNSHILGIRDITTEDGDRILKFQQPYGAIALNIKYGAYHPSRGHTIMNALEFLDEPGEFYFDRKKKTLYYMPREGEDITREEVYAPKLGSMISIQGNSKTDRVSNLTFEGITFAYTEAELCEVDGSFGKSTVQAATHCIAFDEPDWHTYAYRAYDTMPNAVTVNSAESIQFKNNVLKHIGNEGIGFINDVVDSKIVGNLLYDVGGGAVQVGHPQHVYEGDEPKHAKYTSDVEGVCRNNLVENNVMYDMTTMFYGHAPITAYFVDGLQLVRNHIQKCNYTAVSVGWGWNNFDEISTDGNPTTTCRNNVFSFNRVYDCMNMLHDGGAYYTLGSQPNSTSDGNYVKADTTHFQGVYHPDEGTAWYTGKDLVFEVLPDQDIMELNKWRRKRDNHYSNIYSTSEGVKLGAPNCTVTDLHLVEDAKWPEAALAIIRASGVEEKYHHLLKVIPDMAFEPGKRYDTTWSVITPQMIANINKVQDSTDGRFEAEQANMVGGATVGKKHKGFSGKGFVEGFYKSDTAKLTFKVSAEEMGTHNVNLRYAAGHEDSKNTAIYVNGEKSEVLSLKSTGAWDKWTSQSISAFLQPGMNTITFQPEYQSEDCINVDYIQVSN